ncbi:NAD(P)H-dependent oxidoreductase subunit E [Pontiella sulfatireligans]|uniref:NAD-reducing hydrogenase HoxS subunit alpha n=1 Tax=Pontiella sulfatireligans TaxID=2750658 RepID=A0A6C2UKX6_9BACT|nr:NAD(P)H-dependent oxidoreductase subunit E [Pontiella sulfatireligans]VGO20892.1 NAD-reducing hydrogenase HoxS subunit alpha [Pontiella sulfatireligans]
MSELVPTIREICKKYGNDRARLMDMVREVQESIGHVPREAFGLIASEAKTHRVEVESVVSFYSFLSDKKKGEVVIRLCDDIIDRFQGADAIGDALIKELGIGFGETTADGTITLEKTACIGMSDQAPAMMANDTVVTNLAPEKIPGLVKQLRENPEPQALVTEMGDGNNADPLVQSMVCNNICEAGPVILSDYRKDGGLRKALTQTPEEVIEDIKTSQLRGRGGAGFLTGLKWELTRQAPGPDKFVLCNADEGEPGTFKDRVLLTERVDLVLEGMTVAAYAIGAETGIIYLRGEYSYLRAFLEDKMNQRRVAGLLGNNILGNEGFNFDVRIQMGAGAYVCGEETSLISSCEGTRGDPTDRTPFPVVKGYMVSPTAVNNVESYCCAARIMDKGPGWFSSIGTERSAGTKLLSVCGDCARPGIYEVPFGTKLREVLRLAGAEDVACVCVGGPSGQMVGPAQFELGISYEELSTGGSVMVFSNQRDILEVADAFMEFFVDESCGYCVPCRVGNVLLKNRLERVRKGEGSPADLDYLQRLGESVKFTSRCGLGQTSPNPVLSTLKNFRPVYNALVKDNGHGLNKSFNIMKAVEDASAIAGRRSEIFHA